MRKAALLTLGVLVLAIPLASAQTPDLRDSIIIESKVVGAGIIGTPAMWILIYITNKDSLTGIILPLVTTSGNDAAYATLSHPRTFEGVIWPLTGNLSSGTADFSFYHSDSPDSFLISATSGSPEPPNSFRTRLWELKFDTVGNSLGCMAIDSVLFPPNYTIGFINGAGMRVPVHFLKGHIIVTFADGCCPWRFCPGYYWNNNTIYVRPGESFQFWIGRPDCEGEWTVSVAAGPGSVDSNGNYTFPGYCRPATFSVVIQAAGRSAFHCGCDPVDSVEIIQCGFSITVVSTQADFNCDGRGTAADVVLLINCVFWDQPLPVEASCDVNCDGQNSAADVVLEVNAVFLQEPFPC